MNSSTNSCEEAPRLSTNNVQDIVQLGQVRVPILPSVLSPLIINGIRKGWYEQAERKTIEAAVRSGDRVLELGGGLGVCAATAATSAQLAGLTVVEANPKLLDAIRLTMALNSVENFELIWGAVSAETASTTRLEVGEHYWAVKETASQASDTVEVPVIPIQRLIERINPQILICDIEGNEQHLIEVADLSGVRSFIVEFHPNVYGIQTMEVLDAKLRATGFRRVTEWVLSDRPQVHHYSAN